MKLATIRTDDITRAARVDDDAYTVIGDFADVGELLRDPSWPEIARRASGCSLSIDETSLAPVVTSPGKIICVGANYRAHIEEMGAEIPSHPTLFAKFTESLVGAQDDIELPAEDAAVDWEAELALVIGAPARRVSASEAGRCIAGYSVLNDVSMRDHQFRTGQWLQGKTWENSTPFGPYLVTPEDFCPADASVTTAVDGETVQHGSTSDLVFRPEEIIAYISTIVTLRPGDVIATGTPSGVGHAHRPPRYLTGGSMLETSIQGLGTLRNRAVPSGATL